MIIDVLTLFPKMFDAVLGESMLKRAQNKRLAEIRAHNLRDWTSDAHRTADDKPFGGGAGMVMKIEPVFYALIDLGVCRLTGKPVNRFNRLTGTPAHRHTKGVKVVLLTPQGKRFDQKSAKKLAKAKHLILICGHYEGVDERIRELADEEISIGDYILTCGELPAMVLIDSIVRLIPGVLGGGLESTKFESFENGMLEYPQWTRPAEFRGKKAPQVLLSGDHKRIEEWRKAEAMKRTRARRPDLLIKSNRKTRRQCDG
ncbi:MAG: tRNA (guanosine(37)-N1)-methyltransferase TrmD [Candidatus Omnitrophota bacterium]|nr:tRNA (guanosine(37)-N1)-methyltransferase TrmD [Candidatus Omnitrophota bacterium]